MGQQVPGRLHPDTPLAENLAIANDNFDKAVQDISDLGAKFSDIGFASFNIPAGGMHTLNVSVLDDRAQYQGSDIQIVPRLTVNVDADDVDHHLTLGGSLTSNQQNLLVTSWVDITRGSSSVARFACQFLNRDGSAHDYFVYVDESYMDSPSEGYFR